VDRIGASLNAALGLDALLARNEDEYYLLAVRLLSARAVRRRGAAARASSAAAASTSDRDLSGPLAALRHRVEQRRASSLIFDIAAWTRGWERALYTTWDALLGSGSNPKAGSGESVEGEREDGSSRQRLGWPRLVFNVLIAPERVSTP
jgi:hypothetical protein